MTHPDLTKQNETIYLVVLVHWWLAASQNDRREFIYFLRLLCELAKIGCCCPAAPAGDDDQLHPNYERIDKDPNAFSSPSDTKNTVIP